VAIRAHDRGYGVTLLGAALELLDRAGVRATFFIVGWIAELYPRLVEAVRDACHEIGSHSYRHQRVYELDRAAFTSDLRASIGALKASGRISATASVIVPKPQ